MLKSMTFHATLIVFAMCVSASAAAIADTSRKVDVPAGELTVALQELAKQSGVEFVYSTEQLKGVRTGGVHGEYTAEKAVTKLLEGTKLKLTLHESGALLISDLAGSASGGGGSNSAFSSTGEAPRLAQVDRESQPATASGTNSEARPVTLEEIIVTAQKREQNLMDVPISITAISGDKIAAAGITDMQDLSFAVPSMSTAEISPGRQLITLRGMGGTRGTSSLTGVYLDEMPISGLQDNFIATYIDAGTTDLERVEVLKGPQGTLFGEGSVGGTIRLITKDPDLTRAGGKVSASLYDTHKGGMSKEATGVLNVPVVENKFGLRAEAAYESEGGWIDRVQTVNGPVIKKDFNDTELLNFRVKGLWRPTTNLAVKGMVVVHRSEGDGSNIVNLDRKASTFIIEFDPTAKTDFTDDYELYNLTATYDFGFAQLLSSSSYSNADSVASLMQRKPLIPAPNPGFQELLIPEYALSGSSFSQELRLVSTGRGPLSWTAGAYYKDSELTRSYPLGYDFFRFGQRVGAGRLEVGVEDANKSRAWAIFGDLSFALTSRLELGGGVRYFEEDRENFGVVGTTLVPAPRFAGTFDATTYRTYLSYAIADDVRVYGSVSTGFRSGGFNGAAAVNAGAPATFDPETVTSYELGTKMALADRRVVVQAAVFYGEYTDIQLASIFTDPNGIAIRYTGNPGEAEIKGFEIELNFAATDRLSLGVSGDVIDTKITKADARVDPPPYVVGDPIDLVPEFSMAASIDYRVNWSSSVPGHIRAQFTRQGETTNSLRSLGALEPITYTPVLNFLSASIGANVNGWELELFGRNLLDEDGALRSGGGIDPQARPRTFGVRVGKSF